MTKLTTIQKLGVAMILIGMCILLSLTLGVQESVVSFESPFVSASIEDIPPGMAMKAFSGIVLIAFGVLLLLKGGKKASRRR